MPKGTSCHKTIMTMIERVVHVVYITIYSISLNSCTWKLNHTSCARAVGSFFMVVVGPPWLNKLFFENIISGIQLFNSCSNVPVEIDFFDIKFSSRMSQSQPKLAKKITHFKIQFWSKNLTHFTNLSSLDVENKMLLQHSQKPFWLVSV